MIRVAERIHVHRFASYRIDLLTLCTKNSKMEHLTADGATSIPGISMYQTGGRLAYPHMGARIFIRVPRGSPIISSSTGTCHPPIHHETFYGRHIPVPLPYAHIFYRSIHQYSFLYAVLHRWLLLHTLHRTAALPTL